MLAPDAARHAASFPLAFDLATGFGRCVGVHLPEPHGDETEILSEALHPEEWALCRALKGARRIEWAGGRIASRLARAGGPCAGRPTLIAANGVPEVVGGVRVSISHTRGLAVALAGDAPEACIGVDIEPLDAAPAEDRLLAEKILSPEEQQSVPHIPVVQRLSLKEAAFKAVCALTGRRLSLAGIAVRRCAGTAFEVALSDATIRVAALSLVLSDIAPKDMAPKDHVLSLARAMPRAA